MRGMGMRRGAWAWTSSARAIRARCRRALMWSSQDFRLRVSEQQARHHRSPSIVREFRTVDPVAHERLILLWIEFADCHRRGAATRGSSGGRERRGAAIRGGSSGGRGSERLQRVRGALRARLALLPKDTMLRVLALHHLGQWRQVAFVLGQARVHSLERGKEAGPVYVGGVPATREHLGMMQQDKQGHAWRALRLRIAARMCPARTVWSGMLETASDMTKEQNSHEAC
jgi:hypothetical protein